MEFTAIDVETATNQPYSICQIGLVAMSNGRVEKELSLLIQPPGNAYSRWNTLIHGICASLTSGSPAFDEVWPSIESYLDGRLIVAHNAAFDSYCLKRTLEYYGLGIPNWRWDCTLKRSGLNLTSACEAYGIELYRHHDALCDAMACARIYEKLQMKVEPDLTRITGKTKRDPFSFEGHERICGDLLKPELENADPDSPFYNKKIVFTGVLSRMDRLEAARRAKELGADIDTSVTKKTDFIIVGSAPGMSKLRKADKYNAEGANIVLLTESEFLELIDYNSGTF